MPSIYLDNAATTRPLESIRPLYDEYSEHLWYNPSALYASAVEVKKRMEEVREVLLRAFGSAEHRCLFTSGGTEGANMAIRFGARKRKGANYVCGGFEHPCVEESFRALQEAGEEVRFVPCDEHGHITAEAVLETADERTVLVSVMHVNNETGALNDVSAIAKAVKAKAPHAVFHADGVQAFGRIMPSDPSVIDYYTVSAHKIHGLKGTGALLYRPSSPLHEMLRGGGQESGLRSGTENVFGILAMGRAAEYFREHTEEICERLRACRRAFDEALGDGRGIYCISAEPDVQHIAAVSFAGVRGETLMHAVEAEDIYVSTGSACSSRKGRTRAARVLGISEETAAGMVRVSFGAFTKPEEAAFAARKLKEHAAALSAYRRV